MIIYSHETPLDPVGSAPNMNLLFTASFPGFTPAPPRRATRNEADLRVVKQVSSGFTCRNALT